MFRWIVLLILTTAAIGFAQEAGKAVYSESFKKGATKITEQTLDVTLTPERAR